MFSDTEEISRQVAEFAGWKRISGRWWHGDDPGPFGGPPDFADGLETCSAYLPDVLDVYFIAWNKNQKLWLACVAPPNSERVFTALHPSPSMAVCQAVISLIEATKPQKVEEGVL